MGNKKGEKGENSCDRRELREESGYRVSRIRRKGTNTEVQKIIKLDCGIIHIDRKRSTWQIHVKRLAAKSYHEIEPLEKGKTSIPKEKIE